MNNGIIYLVVFGLLVLHSILSFLWNDSDTKSIHALYDMGSSADQVYSKVVKFNDINSTCNREFILHNSDVASVNNSYFFIWERLKSLSGAVHGINDFNTSHQPPTRINHSQAFMATHVRHCKSIRAGRCDDVAAVGKFILVDHLNDSHSRRFYDNFFQITSSFRVRRLLTLREIFSNNFGLIIEPKTCTLARNGGCFVGTFKKNFITATYAPYYDRVISLTATAHGHYHFPIEIIVALAELEPHFISNCYVHIPGKTEYMLAWLDFVGVSSSQVIDDPFIYAATLFVPEQGKCYAPFYSQISWLRERRDTYFSSHPPVALESYHAKSRSSVPINQGYVHNYTHDLEDTTPYPLADNRTILIWSHSPKALVIIYIKRYGIRSLTDDNEIEVINMLYEFALARNHSLIVLHSNALPPLPLQILYFSRAHVVVGVHGAGLAFIAFAQPHSCVLEIMPARMHVLCYARLAYMMGFDYAMLWAAQDRTETYKYHVNILELSVVLTSCSILQREQQE